MAGEKELSKLIAGMDPVLSDSPFGIVSVARMPASIEPFAVVREAEGITVIAEERELQAAGLDASELYAKITLNIHSDLAAVGLTAAISQALARGDLPANVVAGFWHDHVFVPWDRRHKALAILRALSG